MPTLKVKSLISETHLTRIKSANVWPHSQRWHARNDNTENEILIFSDLCGQNYFYTWATSFSEVICNKRQHWKWDFQFVRYIWPKLMYACIDSFSDVNAICAHAESEVFISETCLTRIKSANVWPHSQRWHAMNGNTENVVIKFWDLSDANYAANKPPHSQSWHALYGNPENEVFNLWDIYHQS